MSDLITIAGTESVSLSITPEAIELKNSALADARRIPEVRDLATQTSAARALSEINGILKSLEASRTEIKRPVLELGKRIDSVAAQFAAELNGEKARLNDGIQSHFRREKEAADTLRRMQESLAEKRRAAAEASARQAAEEVRRIEQAAAEATSAEQAQKLEAQARETARLAAEAQAKAAAAMPPPAAAAPAKSEKMAVRTVWKHRVVNIAALYASRPDLVELTPKTNAINGEVRSGMRECEGLEIYEETDVTVRS